MVENVDAVHGRDAYEQLEATVINSSRTTILHDGKKTVKKVKACAYVHPDVPGLAIEAHPSFSFKTHYTITHIKTGYMVMAQGTFELRAPSLGDAYGWLVKLSQILDWSTIADPTQASALPKKTKGQLKELFNEARVWQKAMRAMELA